jgi:CDP-glucose 4,6-dehydratase
MNREFWKGRRIFLTGHTGFKGGWLSLWLQDMGAEVHGYALQPATDPNLYTVAQVETGMASSTFGDIRDIKSLVDAMQAAVPEIVIHMAAQPLVRYSYAEPVETYATNVMGAVNLFEAVRSSPGVKAVVNVTTDKCYENREWLWGYREHEPLGGHDPYSSSKACAELVTTAYRRSFFQQSGVAVASVRAGNVIGGGDWADDRLVPDILRAIDRGESPGIRSPGAIRPWQHVLEPLSGYLLLAERMCLDGAEFAEAWNFGPADDDVKSVGWIVEYLMAEMSATNWRHDQADHPHEAHYLKLDSSKAVARLGWRPRWRLREALVHVLEWHSAWRRGSDMREFTIAQVRRYIAEGAVSE